MCRAVERDGDVRWGSSGSGAGSSRERWGTASPPAFPEVEEQPGRADPEEGERAGFRDRVYRDAQLRREGVGREPTGPRVAAQAPGMLEAGAAARVAVRPGPVDAPARGLQDDPVRRVGGQVEAAGGECRLRQGG